MQAGNFLPAPFFVNKNYLYRSAFEFAAMIIIGEFLCNGDHQRVSGLSVIPVGGVSRQTALPNSSLGTIPGTSFPKEPQ